MEITEKFLVSIGGWPVMKEARALHRAGAVHSAEYESPVLRGRVVSGGKEIPAGLRIKNPIDIENLCPCRDSRARGMICAHSVAVGLQFLLPQAGLAQNEPRRAPQSDLGFTETSEPPKVVFSVEGSLNHLEGKIAFEYSAPRLRNNAAEAAALLELQRLGFEDDKGKPVLRGENAVVSFFASGLPRLKRKWTVREGERFQHVSRGIERFEPAFAIRERSDGWLDFHVHFTAGGKSVLSGEDLQRLLRSGSPKLKLSDGRIAVPDGELMDDLEQVLRDCDPRREGQGYRIRKEHAGYLAASVAEWKNAEAEPEKPTTSRLGPLASRLRPYQVEGASWLLERAQSNGFGLLADEMGLGKTIQALAMFEALPGPHLVVCPSSLVWNWRSEAARFVPGLKVLQLDGPDRAKRFGEIPQHGLAITSYALLRRDLEAYRPFEFRSVVLDEAQHIKNPGSQNARSACALRAGAKFILTGTPLENSLRDLWSLFEFLRPGYLGTKKDFEERYEKPLLAGAQGSTWSRLLRRIRPWMLRRTKAEILPELPPKIEQTVEVELTPEQKAAYTQLQIAARAEVDALKNQGGAARMRVLTALLRLRQASCDLRLLGSKAERPSAKIEALMEILGEAIDGGHRVLVFSQFTAVLDLIAPALEAEGISFCRLDGSTKDRGGEVGRFQGDASIPIFLISLKAGGAGLNLTGADTVVHFDPWWNPAAEAQATDRAHRIGQQSVVTSIKLVARDTVEQRVLDMQSRKRELAAGLFDTEMPEGPMDAAQLAELVG
jgi:superfamily II DNA or RNA helicase